MQVLQAKIKSVGTYWHTAASVQQAMEEHLLSAFYTISVTIYGVSLFIFEALGLNQIAYRLSCVSFHKKPFRSTVIMYFVATLICSVAT